MIFPCPRACLRIWQSCCCCFISHELIRYESSRGHKIDGTKPNQTGNTFGGKQGKQTEESGQESSQQRTSSRYKQNRLTEETNKRQPHKTLLGRVTSLDFTGDLHCFHCIKNPVWPSSCVTPAGTSNELDVQNGWEENTHTHCIVEKSWLSGHVDHSNGTFTGSAVINNEFIISTHRKKKNMFAPIGLPHGDQPYRSPVHKSLLRTFDASSALQK